MGFKTVDEIVAFQLAEEFKRAVYDLVGTHLEAQRDLRFRDQLFQAASGPPSHIAEGFARYGKREFIRYLSYARGSLTESLVRLQDGIDRGFFTAEDCAVALQLGRRSLGAVSALQRSLRDLP